MSTERQPPTTGRSPSAFAPGGNWPFPVSGGRAALVGGLLLLAGAAWVASDLTMSGMDAGPGTNPGALGFYLVTWVVMMVAMMFPSITPMALAYRDLEHGRRARSSDRNVGALGLFLAGYLTVWVMVGLLAYALLEAGRAVDSGFFAWDFAGRWTAAGVLAAAALYQLTPSKRACLSRCRERRQFLRAGWGGGRREALHLGVEHGAWCVGCCWVLMAALFALGAMSIAWMALIAALIAAERLAPWRAASTLGVASILAAVAIGIAAAPAQVPMLTVPGSSTAMRAMGMSPAHQMPMGETRTAPHTGPMSR